MTPAEQRRLLDDLEKRFVKGWRKEIADTINSASQSYEQSGSYAVQVDRHATNVAGLLQDTYLETGNAFARPIYEKAHTRGIVTKDFENFQALIEAFIASAGAEKIKDISSTTKIQIQRVIRSGTQDGLSVPEIAANLRAKAPLLSGFRAALIARTETHTSSQWAQVTAIRDTGLQLRKEWVSAADERTRSNHRDANRQTVGMDESFTVGGEQLEFPGDPAGSAGNVINCRCVLNFVE